jgi:3-phenylpropionate/trans-cinnamate dioxygenase ferredoxin reductase subunit
MLSFFKRSRQADVPLTADINGVVVTVEPKETLLQAALRAGIDFPNSCRVGGCATCKCKLVDGKVKELTETSYILSDEDLDQGYILACQAVPQGPVRIEVDLSAQGAKRKVPGRVVGQERLTHDIVALRVQLDEALPYKAGQFANIGLDALPDVQRSYSFATAVQPNAQVTFFVRRVPGGVFSNHVNDATLTGQGITVEGPMGDFWLRPGTGPLLLVAGGSGLAPILALLEDALAQGVTRPVTLLFGARQQQDLYGQAQIAAIARDWPAGLQFVPVLSAEPEGSDWQGARGMVAERVARHIAPDTQAYLCGPPPMVDAVAAVLQQHGVARGDIHADRFTTLHDSPAAGANARTA